jgi:hypothetical protein
MCLCSLFARERIIEAEGGYIPQVRTGPFSWESVDRDAPDKLWTWSLWRYQRAHSFCRTIDQARDLLRRHRDAAAKDDPPRYRVVE